ncbi:hypothetical protein [uncultured Aureimonas sp.]|uniref:hypothetical protein n=1 Tax=uncultured Aureimonas sp. TaxID=1604662 RepID=UPI0025D5B60A|nr:hypothetical protein [uncultured Aureimonas sp.]
MPMTFVESTVRMEGACGVEDAPALGEWLEAVARPTADLKDSTHLHTAIVQALAEAAVPVSVAPADPFLARWVAPLLPVA